MTISNRFTPRPLPPVETIQTGRASTIGPSPSTLPAAKAKSGRSLFSEKLGGFRADALSAGLRLFSDPSVKNAMAYVKSAVTSLSGSVVHAFGAATGRINQVAPQPEGQAPQHSISQDPGFSAAFGKWVQDNKFEGAKPTPAKLADDAVLRTRVSLPITQPAPAAAAHGEPPAPRAGEPERQAPRHGIAQDPGFGAAFDKWVQDNKFEGAKPASAKPANEKMVQTPATLPTAPPAATLAPLVDIEAPVSPRPQQPAKAPAQPPAPATAQARQERPTPVSVRTRPQQLAPAAARQELPTPAPAPTRQEPPTPAAVQTRQEPASPAGSPTAMLLNRKQELNSSQSDLLGLLPQLGEVKQPKEKASTPDDKIPARTSAGSVPTEAAGLEPQGKVYTNPAAFAKALDQWERDNHFDYDNPMPAGHVSEPRPEFKPSAPRADGPAAAPPATEVKGQRQAELAAHQEALDAGYR